MNLISRRESRQIKSERKTFFSQVNIKWSDGKRREHTRICPKAINHFAVFLSESVSPLKSHFPDVLLLSERTNESREYARSVLMSCSGIWRAALNQGASQILLKLSSSRKHLQTQLILRWERESMEVNLPACLLVDLSTGACWCKHWDNSVLSSSSIQCNENYCPSLRRFVEV